MMSSVGGYSRLRFSLYQFHWQGYRVCSFLEPLYTKTQPPLPIPLFASLLSCTFRLSSIHWLEVSLHFVSYEDEGSDITCRGHARFYLHASLHCRYIPVMQMELGLDPLGKPSNRKSHLILLHHHHLLLLLLLFFFFFPPLLLIIIVNYHYHRRYHHSHPHPSLSSTSSFPLLASFLLVLLRLFPPCFPTYTLYAVVVLSVSIPRRAMLLCLYTRSSGYTYARSSLFLHFSARPSLFRSV